jgi:hypothetical protein
MAFLSEIFHSPEIADILEFALKPKASPSFTQCFLKGNLAENLILLHFVWPPMPYLNLCGSLYDSVILAFFMPEKTASRDNTQFFHQFQQK